MFVRVLLGDVDQLTREQRSSARMFGERIFAAGHGYGMGVAVVLEPDKADAMRGRDGTGTIGWPGAYGSWCRSERSIGVDLPLAHDAGAVADGARNRPWRVDCHRQLSRDSDVVSR